MCEKRMLGISGQGGLAKPIFSGCLKNIGFAKLTKLCEFMDI